MAIFVICKSQNFETKKNQFFRKSLLETKRLDQKSKYLVSEHVQG